MMRHLAGVGPLTPEYDGFIIDLWGVIHDGTTLYGGALDALRRLRATGKPVVLLSNAPRRAWAAREGLRALGVSDDLYSAVMTSGEATWTALGDYGGARVFHLGPDRDRNVLDGRDLTRVERPEDASLLLNTGPDDRFEPTSIEPYLPEVAACLAAGLPMICANPDLEVIRAGGVRVVCAGALALWYEERGGKVRWIGKPHPEIYATTLAMLGVPASRTLAIGDALRTDVAGAQVAGVDCCWVLGGIHALERPEQAEAEAEAVGLRPIATVPAFRW